MRNQIISLSGFVLKVMVEYCSKKLTGCIASLKLPGLASAQASEGSKDTACLWAARGPGSPCLVAPLGDGVHAVHLSLLHLTNWQMQGPETGYCHTTCWRHMVRCGIRSRKDCRSLVDWCHWIFLEQCWVRSYWQPLCNLAKHHEMYRNYQGLLSTLSSHYRMFWRVNLR